MLTLQQVGLGYIHIGQQATTLSGGEAQRVKRAKELSRRATGRTVYILDEPTTGLHFEDVRKLLEVLHRLVESGNTVIVIEHNLSIIAEADYVVDIGPEAGANGGEIVATGTPEEVAMSRISRTAPFLRDVLGGASHRMSS
jgi:excinuclease ABC subunit A